MPSCNRSSGKNHKHVAVTDGVAAHVVAFLLIGTVNMQSKHKSQWGVAIVASSHCS